MKFDRFFSRAGRATPRVVERVPAASPSARCSHDDRYYDDLDEAGFGYYTRALQRGIYLFAIVTSLLTFAVVALFSLSLSLFLLRSQIVYFRVFYLAGHCCGHARTTLFTVPVIKPPLLSPPTSIFYSASFRYRRGFLSYRAINDRQKNSI